MRSKSVPSTIIKLSVKRANEDEAQDTRTRTPLSKRSKHDASPKCLKYGKDDHNTIKRKEARTNPKKTAKTMIDKASQELIAVDEPPSMRQKGQNHASTSLRGKQVTEMGRRTLVKPTNAEAPKVIETPLLKGIEDMEININIIPPKNHEVLSNSTSWEASKKIRSRYWMIENLFK
ncbi:hypothetical protein ACH5RR_039252 [Cinchona calisaya]|uniref:Uncharacterized protein n=1 Tax=Cinchona calisaya TaxID=153742 RepID=A0ABD2XXR0_9GENT